MNSDRAATTRMKAAGQICSDCKKMLNMTAWAGGPRLCEKCEHSRMVLMTFSYSQCEWAVTFVDTTSKLPLGRIWRLGSADAIKALVDRSMTSLRGPKQRSFEAALASGKGELLLEVSAEQYAKLKR